jgi:two-component system, OmpR family, sensor histidine kinase KdpD
MRSAPNSCLLASVRREFNLSRPRNRSRGPARRDILWAQFNLASHLDAMAALDTTASIAIEPSINGAPLLARAYTSFQSIGIGLGLSLAFAPIVLFSRDYLHLHDPEILYLVPVIFAATRWDLVCGLAAAIGAIASAAYLLFEPVFNLRVDESHDVTDMITFFAIALITGQLASKARVSAAVAKQSCGELELLYAFSRRLSSATMPGEVCLIVQEYASGLTGAPAFVTSKGIANCDPTTLWQGPGPPEFIRATADELAKETQTATNVVMTDPASKHDWIVTIHNRGEFGQGTLFVDVGPSRASHLAEVQPKVDAMLENAVATFQRLESSANANAAAIQLQAEELREALIGSVSHGLRTPLASILGSATVLSGSSVISAEPHLAASAGIIVSEARRLNDDIQKLLDAATVSSKGLRPKCTLVEAADLINAALETGEPETHKITLSVPNNLPFVSADPMLIVQALRLIIDNACRYSQIGTEVRLAVASTASEVTMSIEDQGPGIRASEMAHALDRFYRGVEVRETTRGSGLGLWIASAFVTACDGRLELAPAEDGRSGLRVLIVLPAASEQKMRSLEFTNEQ